MERIEGLYKIKEPPTDFFRDEDYVRNKLETKKQYNFYERAQFLKKRISFFGIYTTAEQVEMLDMQFDYMRRKAIKLIELMIKQQNQIVAYANKHRQEQQPEIEKFEFVKNLPQFTLRMKRQLYLTAEHADDHDAMHKELQAIKDGKKKKNKKDKQ